ncbi:MAG: hypothetical protein IRZ09_06975 [Variibacter sp.]|nr:hypothetical protein [Variibacter sp.]
MQHEKILPGSNGSDGKSPAADGAEFGLIEILAAIASHWRLVLSIVLASAVIGGVTFFSKSPKYEYSTIIEIGSRVTNAANPELLEREDLSLAKLENLYIPDVMHQETLRAGQAGDARPPELKAAVRPRAPGMIVLSSRAREDEYERTRRMHEAVFSLLQKDHARMAQLEKEELERRLQNAHARTEQARADVRELTFRMEQLSQRHAERLRNLDATVRGIETRRKRLEDGARLLQEQIQGVFRTISHAEERQAAPIHEGSDAARAMTILIIGNEIQHYRNRLATLEERLQVGIPRELDGLDRELAMASVEKQNAVREYENARQKLVQELNEANWQIREREAAERAIARQLANLRETQIRSLALRSREPVGLTRSMAFALCLVIGVVVALGAVFGLEVARSVRRRLAQNGAAA